MHAIIDPTALLRGADSVAVEAPRPRGLSGLRVGLFENTKRNAATFLDVLGEKLVAADPSIRLVRRTKGQFGLPMSDELAEEIASECDVVIIGVGDCGSCSATAVSDGIAFEKRGVPTAAVITEIFEANGRAIAELEGAPEYPFLMIPHPFANLPAEGLDERARDVLPRITGRLTDGSPVGSRA